MSDEIVEPILDVNAVIEVIRIVPPIQCSHPCQNLAIAFPITLAKSHANPASHKTCLMYLITMKKQHQAIKQATDDLKSVEPALNTKLHLASSLPAECRPFRRHLEQNPKSSTTDPLSWIEQLIHQEQFCLLLKSRRNTMYHILHHILTS
jgi:hypothetical protein